MSILVTDGDGTMKLYMNCIFCCTWGVCETLAGLTVLVFGDVVCSSVCLSEVNMLYLLMSTADVRYHVNCAPCCYI